MSEVTAQVDALMQLLYRNCKGQFFQTMLASYDIADRWRNYLQPGYPVSKRLIVRLASTSWALLSLLGFAIGIRISFLFWFCMGLSLLVRKSFELHTATFSEDGEEDVELLLLRTGVSNEPNIAAWISTRHNGKPVNMLSYNEKAGIQWRSIQHLPVMFTAYCKHSQEWMKVILRLIEAGQLTEQQVKVLMSAWLVLLARSAPFMCQYQCWAMLYLKGRKITHLYFTMNSMLENAFIVALPETSHAYVEHGFPRRDIPPLVCKQYVYGKRYADYLRSFDEQIEIEEIGIDYFSRGEIGEKSRTIVVASLQDWPQWGIIRVAVRFNAALATAKANGWRIIFRGRNYDEDAFANGLACDWDEISTPKQESFAECLQRLKPAMVWTTWSTAVLDAEAMGARSVCFIDSSLYDYFIPDFGNSTIIVIAQEDLKCIPLT